MSERQKVIVDPHFRTMAEIFHPDDRARLEALAEVVWAEDAPMPADQAAAALPEAVALVTGGWRYGPEALERAPKLRAILDVGGGFPGGIDYEACFARGIRVLSSAWAFGPQVAEMALGMAICAAREIVAGDQAMRGGAERWLHEGNATTFLLYGKPVGFVGFGGLSRALRPLLAPFGCPISVYDPWVTPSAIRRQGCRPADLDTLLRESRVIFVLATPTSGNRALLDRGRLEQIRADAVLVLISRAHLVDFDALTELVLAGRFKAAIDVFPTEPLPADHPIRRAPEAILSAHRAGSVAEGLLEIGRGVVDDLEAILHSLPPSVMQQAQPELIRRR
jgi:phosphoglycerate dehydrogenase-like enzyme